MKLTAGSIFILVALFVGTAGLIGGQIWVYTGSLLLATAAAALALAILVIALRAFLKRAAASLSIRFLGEYGEHLDERDLVDVTEEDAPKLRVGKDAQQKPDQVARSISMMLGGRGQKTRKGN